MLLCFALVCFSGPLLFQANCDQTNAVTFGEYSQAWDFRNTAVGQLGVDVYSNTSKNPNFGTGPPPLNLRINQVCCTCSLCVCLSAVSVSLFMPTFYACPFQQSVSLSTVCLSCVCAWLLYAQWLSLHVCPSECLPETNLVLL